MDDDFLLRNWDLDDGLPSTHINAMARTPDGYVWLATFNGVVRFDGVRFVIFNLDNTPAFKDSRVATLLVDHAGLLWVGTHSGGLLKRFGAGFEAVNPGVSKTAGAVTALTQDPQGALWIGTSDGELVRLGQGATKVFGKVDGWVSRGVSKLLSDATGRLWAVAGGNLLTFEAGQWKLPAGGPPPGQAVQAIAPSSDGGLWVAITPGSLPDHRGGQIMKLKAGQWEAGLETYSWPQNSSASRACALLEDKAGRLWCGTTGHGVFFRSLEGGWQSLTPRAPLSQMETICLEEDQEGAIWIGTRTTGVYQAQPRLLTSRYLPAEVDQSVLVTVCAARDGSVWGGTDGAGVFRWRGRELTCFGSEQGLSNLRVAELLEDQHSNLWAGTYGGVFRLKGDRFEPVTEPAALRDATFALLEDAHGHLWAGTRNGLVCLEEGQSTVYGKGDGLPSAPVRALAEDRDGCIWVGLAEQGLYRQKGERFERYKPKRWSTGTLVEEWAGENAICALHWDEEGSLWLGTRGFGLYRLRDDELKHWEWRLDGLPSNHLFALLEDNSGNLWFSSENGIFGLSKKTLNNYQRRQRRLLTPWRLTPAEGLPLKVCTGMGQPAAAKSPDGRLWFPDGVALATFDPATIARGVRIWPPIIEEAIVDGIPLAPDKDGVLRVKSGARSFGLRFSSPNTLSSERLRFRYRLEGLDKEWFEGGNLRMAQFYRLPPGSYRFSVEASGPDETWQPAASPLRLEVVPRLYERPSARAAAMVALLAVVAGTVWTIERSRSRRRLERLKLQQAMDHERQRIAADIHDELGAGLTEITLLGDALHRDIRETLAVENVTREISARARSLTRSMDEVVWAINPHNDTLEGFLNYLNRFAQEYLNKAGLRYRWDVPLELPEMLLWSEARHHLYLASKEAIHNIIKHAGASEVWIRLQFSAQSFTLTIEDNGKGFDILAPLARGNGLANMRRRLEGQGGQCQIESSPGEGTRVQFVMACPPPAC
jgi:ligand-binding sensor domain-containing protein/signal transduction histidine kinase